MGEIVSLLDWAPKRSLASPHDALVRCFSTQRRSDNDVFWLKENAELLNILECASNRETRVRLEDYMPFYEGIERRLFFFRQYYRFYLSICMDLEDLGVQGEKAACLAQWAKKHKLAEGELSDLQRAEARRLLARRNIELRDDGLSDRLRAFAQDSARFAMPNTKIAYELTHIVFYLSEYGRRDPDLQPEALESLRNVGLLAFIDQNMDLLAEVCISLRYANDPVPDVWEQALAVSMRGYRFVADGFDGAHDDYHAYFVGAWWSMLAGQGGFHRQIPVGNLSIQSTRTPGVMRRLSQIMYADECLARLSWSSARPSILAALPPEEGAILRQAEQSTQGFDKFYEGFARFGRAG